MAAIDVNAVTDPNATIPSNSEPAPAPTEEASGVPPEVLELPIVRGLLEGSPPALWADVGTKTPEIATVLKHGEALNKIGIGFFRSEKDKIDLAYNTQYLDPALVKAAAAKGKLKEISEPYAEVSARIGAAVGAPASGGAPAPTGGSTEMNLTASPINTARINNLQPGSPTSGPAPAQGRVLNSLLRPTI